MLATLSGGRLDADAVYPNKGIDRHGNYYVIKFNLITKTIITMHFYHFS